MVADTVLDIIAQGAWNGGNLVDNSIYENKGLTFKGSSSPLALSGAVVKDFIF